MKYALIVALVGLAWFALSLILGLAFGRAIPPSHSDIHRNDAADSQGSAGSGVGVGGHVAMRNTTTSE